MFMTSLFRSSSSNNLSLTLRTPCGWQVFGLTREIRATHGEGHNVSVMMLTDGVHNGLATPSWWTGPPPADCAFPLGTFVFRDGVWTKSADNTCTLDKGLARAVPPSTPVTFVGIKVGRRICVLALHPHEKTSRSVSLTLLVANVRCRVTSLTD